MEPLIKINPGATKWDIRGKVWDYIEDNNLANFPRPVHNRIPNFKDSSTACAKVSELQVFTQAVEVKVDPDKPLEGARLAVLEAHKTLLVPTPRLRSGLFNKIVPPQGANKEQLRICSSSQGVKEFSVPIDLDAKVKIDLVVVGSVAVSEKGVRIGKGEGYADLEYGMMASMGAVNESTVVVTIVHDCQVVDIPDELMESHDLTVDYILTPSRVIQTNCQSRKPQGIIWTKLHTAKLEKIPILKKFLALEEEAGKDVTLGPEPPATESPLQNARPKRQNQRKPRQKVREDAQEEFNDERSGEAEPNTRRRPPRVRKESRGSEGEGVEKRKRTRGGEGNRKEKSQESGGEVLTQSNCLQGVTTVYLGGIPTGLRVSELKIALREKEAGPLRLTWQGAQRRAFLDYSDQQAAEKALEALQGLSLNGQSVQVELAKSQRRSKRPDTSNRRPKPPTAPTCDAEATVSKSDAPEEIEQ
ncbi:methenyltetrahydrofolate synthase domain-containing protein isoform X2 [Entelurus aequoreus]|uniref:methenyltetrahydrofolate synthase domain-containing protein isoform X2 n=1 Tax=Entelurus aequoreus TaxID=161455 RepID=UPI002B1D5B00|nr:methenyltetrahydrofolate synthase domain-containing protein isoform X2 [Entelurus aequoreus]